jgi:hypothetical protein
MSDNPWLIFIAAEIANSDNLPKSIKRMYYLHRFAKGKVCRDCEFMIKHGGNTRDYFKCQHYGITNGAATDWRAHWNACGLYKERER